MEERDTLYARWLSGDLSPAEMAELKASGEWEALQAIIEATDQLELPAMDLDDAFAKLKKNQGRSQANVRSLPVRWLAGIAAGLLMILFSWYLLSSGNQTIQAGLAANAGHQFKDGSKVILNDGSSIAFQDQNWEEERIVKLTGEAYFEVEPGIPFSVQSRQGRVEVLGTRFNVRSWGDRLQVECYEGQVQVVSGNASIRLGPFESALFGQGQLLDTLSIEHDRSLWEGTEGVSRFRNAPIAEVFQELGRQFDIDIQINTTLDFPFSGQFVHRNVETAVNQICRYKQELDCQYIADQGLLVVK